jgi:Cu/Ag efflux protein CusF
MTRGITVLAVLVGLASSSLTHAQTVTKVNSQTATATIQAIDSTARRLTLRNEKGDALKVGDKVKMTYYESLVFQVRKPGEKPNPATDEAAFTRAKGALPGGTIARQEKRTVTVKSIDTALPSITVTTEDGRTVTRKVEEKKNLDGVKVGDKIDITYTEALLTGVEPVK